MNEYLLGIKSKFGYSDELLKFLGQLIPNLIMYYGEEYKDIILSALSNCEIHFQSKDEDSKTFLNSYFDTNEEWKLPMFGGAFYQNQIKVIDNQVVAKPIIYLKRVYHNLYEPFDFSDSRNVSILVHEICHLIKGYGKLKVENGKIIDSTGLLKITYLYNPETGVISEESSNMVGIEEALNDVETAQILEMMTGRKQEINGYKSVGCCAIKLLQHSDIAKVIKISQFRGDDSWIQYLGEEQSKLLIENFDILVKLMYVSYKDINTEDKRKDLLRKKREAYAVIIRFVDTYCPREDSELFIQSLAADKNYVTNVKLSTQI